MLQLTLTALALSVMLTHLWQRCLFYLRFLQQDDYRPKRFVRWVWKERCLDWKGIAIATVTAALTPLAKPLAFAVGVIALLALVALSEDPRRSGKLPLVMTSRAYRLHRLAVAIAVGASLCFALVLPAQQLWWGWVVVIVAEPLYLLTAWALLQPGERRRQEQYAAEARHLLRSVDPFVIGITGSYGKTSTKDALGRVLNVVLGPTLWPPKGVNTPMGITREIRNHLCADHRYAVVEMGAYGRGSIERLCRLTPPQAGILTCIGAAHLERFGSKEVTAQAKAELAQAVPEKGILVCNGDDPLIRKIARDNPKKTTLFYGFDESLGPLDCFCTDFQLRPEGMLFSICWNGTMYEGTSPQLGKPALSNLLAVFTMACALGADPEFVIAAIRNVTAVDNRLQVARDDTRITIRDAYNSNPVGFRAALDVLEVLPGKRRLLMTPGIIELGAEQESENRAIAKRAAQCCDKVLLVGHCNREALLQGLRDGGLAAEDVVLFDHRDQALAYLDADRCDGDLVLIENDLPDLYEA